MSGITEAAAGTAGNGAVPRHRPFLSMLSADDAAALQSQMVHRTAPAGTKLLHAGAPGDSLILVLEGRVKLVTRSGDGRGMVLAICEPGDLVGELAALDGQMRCADAIALDPVRVGVMTSCGLRAYLAQRPSAALAMMRLLARRLRDANRERLQLATDDSLGRIAIRLLELAERYGNPGELGVRIELAMTQEELAAWTGSSRETVARALRLMRKLGCVLTSRREITVVNLEALREHRTAVAA